MDWKDKVKLYLGERKDSERQAGGYKGLATRLSKELGKSITPAQVKSYLKKKDKELRKEGKMKYIERGAKKAREPGAYKWGKGGAIFSMLKGHFAKS